VLYWDILAYRRTLDAPYRGACELREPTFRLALGLIEFDWPTEKLVPLSVTSPEARRPRVRSTAKAEEGAPAGALEVRCVTYRQAFAR